MKKIRPQSENRAQTKNSVLKKIKRRGRGWVFTAKDFPRIEKAEVSKALRLIVKQGTINSVSRGIYCYPYYSKLLARFVYAPPAEKVAQIIARRHGWNICPTGLQALNIFHLSAQVPARIAWASSGPNRQYKIGNRTLYFEHISPQIAGIKEHYTVLVAQALSQQKSENRLDADFTKRLSKVFPLHIWKEIAKQAANAPYWIQETISAICDEKEKNSEHDTDNKSKI